MAQPMDCEHTQLLHEFTVGSHHAALEPDESPKLDDKHRFRIAAVLSFAEHSGNAHDAGEALKLRKEWAQTAMDKGKNLAKFIRDWYGNFVVRGHIFDGARCVGI